MSRRYRSANVGNTAANVSQMCHVCGLEPGDESDPCGYNPCVSVATKPRIRAGVREVKNNLSAYLERVRDGEEIVITDRGHPVARLTSLEPDVDRLHTLVEQGVLKPAAASRALPSRRIRVTGSISELVADERR